MNPHRWNIEEDGAGALRVCRHDHDHGESCHYERFDKHYLHALCVRCSSAEQNAYELEKDRADRFCKAYWELRDGAPKEIRLNEDDTLDEIVGSGGFHVEQMDEDLWFFDLGGVVFFVVSSKPFQPRDHGDWREAREFIGADAVSLEGEVVVTTDSRGECVAVTRQDEEGRMLSLIWERGERRQMPEEWKPVPDEVNEIRVLLERMRAIAKTHRENAPHNDSKIVEAVLNGKAEVLERWSDELESTIALTDEPERND